MAAARARTAQLVDPAALHALALVDLVWSNGAGKALDRSISSLRTASRLLDRPAAALTDLSAALLARAEHRGDARDLFEAAEVASLALEADPLCPAARFNLALALDRMGLVDEAARAWGAYLALGGRDGWAAEARAYERRAEAVAQAPAASFDPAAPDLARAAAAAPQEARLYGWERALGAWGEAALAGDAARARRPLNVARAIGRALETGGGDATLADAVRLIDAAAQDAGRTRALAAAHRAFAAAQADYAARRYAEAGRGFARVAAASAPLAHWARTFEGATHVYGGRRARGERILRHVLARADVARHPALVARARWMLGTTLLRTGRTEAAMREFRSAADTFERIGEREHLGAVRALAARAAYEAGDSRATADAIREALVTLRGHRGSVWLHNALYTAAAAAERDGLVRTALRLQDEDLAVAGRSAGEVYLAEGHLVRARLAMGTGAAGRASAAADVAAARRVLATVQPGMTRDWVTADLRAVEAALLPAAESERAIATLDSVITYFERLPVPARLVPALVARADARLHRGDARGAGADLDWAVALLVAAQNATDSLPMRASMVDATRDMVDRAVMLQVARGNDRDALARLELGRAAMIPRGRRHVEPSWRRHAAGEIVLVYALIRDTLLTWTVTDTLVRLSQTAVSGTEFARVTERARAALELRTADAARAELAQLYEWLVRPVRARLGPGDPPLVVVADGEVGAVPFAALWNQVRGRYLVEDHALRFALSVREPRRAPAYPGETGPALLVADPAFDRGAHPSLRPLAGAAAEAHDIARLYHGSRVLAGANANAPAVLAALPRAALMHYAGHAVFDDERPLRSMLVLAPASTDHAARGEWPAANDGALTAETIVSLDLRRVQLVVLSACETVGAAAGRAGGFAGLAGAFVAAGAGGVVGAQWRVEDGATSALMRAFHRAYARSGDAAAALRVAQLELLRSDDRVLRSPAAWAGFRYLGR